MFTSHRRGRLVLASGYRTLQIERLDARWMLSADASDLTETTITASTGSSYWLLQQAADYAAQAAAAGNGATQPIDPGFEVPVVAAGSSQYDPSLSTWTFSGPAGLTTSGSNLLTQYPGPPDGKQVAFLQGSGSIVQSVNWSDGTYVLSFQAAQSTTNQQSIQVQIDGTSIGTVTPKSSSFSLYEVSFHVTA